MRKFSVYLDSLLIFVLSMAAFSYGLFGRELVGFETRFGLFAKEMLRHGPSLFPTTYGIPYPDYPGLHTFLIYLLSLPLGHLTTLTALLPSALASSVTLVLVYRLLVPMDRTWAIAAVLLSFLTFQFLEAARSLTMDSLLMMVTLWAFCAAVSAEVKTLLSWRMVSLLLALVVGFAIRGPIGLVLPAGVVSIALWSQHGFKAAWRVGVLMLILLVLLTTLLLLAAYHVAGLIFVKQVLQMQIFGRMSDALHHYQTWDYFSDAWVNYALSFELACAVVVVFFTAIIKAANPVLQLLRQSLLWILVVMLGMSIPSVRKIRYIMPIVPALVILASYWWYQTSQSLTKIRVLQVVNYLLLALPFVCIGLVSAFIVVTHVKGMDVSAHYFSAYFLLGLLASFSALIFFHHPKIYCAAKPLRVLALGVASFWVVMVFVINPVDISLNRAKPLVQQLFAQLPTGTEMVFFQMDPDSEAIQFLLAAPSTFQPRFVSSLEGGSTWYLTTQAVFDAQNDAFKARVEVVQVGHLGHRAVVVFRLKTLPNPAVMAKV